MAEEMVELTMATVLKTAQTVLAAVAVDMAVPVDLALSLLNTDTNDSLRHSPEDVAHRPRRDYAHE